MIRLVLAVVISACLMSASLAILSSTIPNTYAMKNAFRGAAMVKMGTESSKIFAQISSSLSKEKILLLPILAIVAIVSAYFLSPFRGYSGTGFASSALSMQPFGFHYYLPVLLFWQLRLERDFRDFSFADICL